MHYGQFAGAVQACQFEGVAPVGLDPVAGPDGDQRGRNDAAFDPQLREPTRQHKASRACLVADAQFGPRVRLAQFGKDSLQGVQVVGDRPVVASFTTAAFGQGNGDVLRVDIESEEQ